MNNNFDACLLHTYACAFGKFFGFIDNVHIVNNEPTYGFIYSLPDGTWVQRIVHVEDVRPCYDEHERNIARKSAEGYIMLEGASLNNRLAMNYPQDDPDRLRAEIDYVAGLLSYIY